MHGSLKGRQGSRALWLRTIGGVGDREQAKQRLVGFIASREAIVSAVMVNNWVQWLLDFMEVIIGVKQGPVHDGE